jgi:hypothetical protein
MLPDKSAQIDLGRPTRRLVVLVTPGDYFLETALSLDPAIKLQVVRPAAYGRGRYYPADVTVFEGMLPATLPRTSLFLIDPPQGRLGDGLRFGREHAAAAITSASRTGLLHYVDLSDVRLSSARTSILPDSLSPLAVSGATTLVAVGDIGPAPGAGPNGVTRVAVIAFDPRHSNWPLLVSYPIVMHNILGFLAGAKAGGVGAALPGRTPFVAGPQVAWFGRTTAGAAHAERQTVDLAWVFGLLALAVVTGEWWYALRR